ncbi:DUF4199 family protein [Spirosoma sp. HMF4905]|uniref:DUF4199 family protein n=1 Tax=Spirosoma arboris TaxID=2682092 RepID=A0A7K1SNI1_9BACT|nr:DUF4199 domain-containing protein [Spirosoma arboris]MVM35362.1 DUF4199 family protein [Spirosoma arboris]
MRKVVLIYGLLAGTIVGGMFPITVPFWRSGLITFDNGMWVGYTTMVIALSLVFFGIKSYRDNHLGGGITFGTAFKVGILITLIASLLYCIAWEICYTTIFPDFMEMAAKHTQEKMKSSGATELEMSKALADFQASAESYKNPFVRLAITFIEVFPVGLLITLLSATLLRKKDFLPVAS